MLVVLLVLGHVCDLAAFAHLDAHHAADGHADEQLGPCEAVPVTSSPGHTQVWAPLESAMALPVAGVVPDRRVVSFSEDPATLADRPPLFLLYASLLI
jgi:hypothetical protein